MSREEQNETIDAECDGLHAFLELSEHGSPHTAGPPRSPRRAVIDLMTFADAAGRLNNSGPWRLAPGESRSLEESLGYAPVGGWATLVALVAGTGAMAATHHGFYPKQTVRAWQDKSDLDIRTDLAEAYTRCLVPPMAAAGLFVSLRIHPLWGLRVAKAQGGAGEDFFDEDDSGAFDPEDLRIAEVATFGAIAGLMSGLAALPAGLAFPMDAVGAFLGACVRTARELAFDAWEPGRSGFEVFLGPESSSMSSARGLDATADDIFDEVLVPAGLVRRLEDGRFTVHEAISNVDVGGFSPAESKGWLGFVTAIEPRFLVA